MSTLGIAMVSNQVQTVSCKKVCLETVLASTIEYMFVRKSAYVAFPIHALLLYELYIIV